MGYPKVFLLSEKTLGVLWAKKWEAVVIEM
jgi:hypothetical protein